MVLVKLFSSFFSAVLAGRKTYKEEGRYLIRQIRRKSEPFAKVLEECKHASSSIASLSN
jgi:hypothetical protein